MWRTVLQRRAYACFLSVLEKSNTAYSKPPLERPFILQCRAFSKPRRRNPPPPAEPEGPLPEPPAFTPEEIEFIDELVKKGSGGLKHDEFEELGVTDDNSELPEAPKITSDWDEAIEADEDTEEIEDGDPVPYFPPIQKSFMLSDGCQVGTLKCVTETQTLEEIQNSAPSEINPELERVLAAWGRAILPSPVDGPLALHELANRSTKVKELVKLGVDMYKIAGRHGDLERLMLLDWERQIKPQIRFLVDIGIQPDRLADFFSRNTALLWTDKDDIEVRLNYLRAKNFSPEQIERVVNGGAFWLTLSTKEIDGRLGFIQKTFRLSGNNVRSIAASCPAVVSSTKWSIFMDTTKLLDREFGFDSWERQHLLQTAPKCYLRPTVLRRAFDFCHNQIGLTHTQLVQHPLLLLNRVHHMKPRYEFLKFLKRDIFDVKHPLYITPDWLWKGTIEEFCEKAKSSVQDFEYFLRHSDHT
ncbi:Transcription termination factor 3, mitochondrial [Frankliniella fusca]|uniref:Transcription termination factor 3, mitochondrial n=1 Tax=Frankliniella fusca TaxID=407009 RepID=A0AAE1LW73_9NEOP|nr:Transcription termination factor 3, mitochondrial [Frankliniella fusca]